MIKKFQIKKSDSSEDSFFDRQERITWWQQETIHNAKIMVVGAGAIGNETLKNLALLGFRNIFIVDFDTISRSNLSRTVLFKKSDIDKQKSEAAANRILEMCLADDPRIDWFHGDVVWELGTGVYRHMDIILGCLDNVETRFAVNRQCRLAKKAWIDTGITELRARVNFYGPTGVCYQCQASPEQYKAARVRYSCDNFKKRYVSEGKVPTVQIASSLVSALQVQEAIKWLCGDLEIRKSLEGKMIYFEGRRNDFDWFEQLENKECLAHAEYPEVIVLDDASAEMKVKDFLQLVSQTQYSDINATLDLSADRSFIETADCVLCSSKIDFYQPEHQIYDTDLVCSSCKAQLGNKKTDRITDEQVGKKHITQYSLTENSERILNMTLLQIGVPYWHILSVKSNDGSYKYYELSGDKKIILSSFFNKNN
jgi:adenylyltransferase/sulfurtransferase